MESIYALGMFGEKDGPQWAGIISEGRVCPLGTLLGEAVGDLFAIFANWEFWGNRIDRAYAETASSASWLREEELTAYLPLKPESLFGAGANYRKHVMDLIIDHGAGGTGDLSRDERIAFANEEMDRRTASGMPFVFVASRGSIAGPEGPLVLPYDISEPDWELELTAVIGRSARRVSAADALDYVAGYTIANDLTARELVSRSDLKSLGMDWMACKGAPGFKVLGPYITPARFVPDPQQLHIRLSLNGRTMQDEGTNDMIFGVARIIEWISRHCELQPGDMIMTGSPSGNGTHYGRFLQDGDEMRGEIDGLVGTQVVKCIAEAPASTAMTAV